MDIIHNLRRLQGILVYAHIVNNLYVARKRRAFLSRPKAVTL